MRPFDYVSVLLSMVLSLAIAHVFNSIVHMISAGVRNVIRSQRAHLALCAVSIIVTAYYSLTFIPAL